MIHDNPKKFRLRRYFLANRLKKVNLDPVNETKNFFKVPDPKNNRDSCSQWLHNIGNAKWNINNFEPKAHRVMCIDHFHVDCF